MRSCCGIFIALILCGCSVYAGDLKYPVSDIPDSLKQGMYAVVRVDDSRFEIISSSKTIYTSHYVVTILNEKAKFMAVKVVGYSKLRKILSFKASAYDAFGNEVKKLKQSEIVDQSATSGGTLFDDNRIKYADISQTAYPYTVEFEYEVQENYMYSIPGYELYDDDEVSIQNSVYTVIYPTALTPRFKLTKVPAPSKQALSESKEQVSWTFANIRPNKFEPYRPSASKYIPNIMAGPSNFDYEGYHGDMSSWKEYGRWNLLLSKDRDILPEVARQKIKELTAGLTTNEQKAKVLYEYMQNKTRYVGIQLGIGGLQPFPASVVDEMGYGDCKALSNYMVAMLKEVGIKGYYTVIESGTNAREIVVDFPSHQFNHAIVAVPNGKDTLWLECTSQTSPFNYMGKFTGSRLALMITEEGGKLVKTTSYSADQNSQTRTANVVVDLLGNAKAKVKTTYRAEQYEDVLVGNQTDEQKKWVQNNTQIPSFTVISFVIKEKKDRLPSATVDLDLAVNRYASVSGKRFFITPNLMNRISSVPEKLANRRTDVVRRSNYTDLDTIIFHFPESLYPEFLPAPVKISSKFGEYETVYKFDGGKLVYIRKMKVWKGTFPKESYNELVDFYKNVSKSDNTKLVFLNKT